LRWAVQRPGITSVIIGAKNISQLKDNLVAATMTLTDEQMARLTKVSDNTPPYPWSMINFVNSGR